MKKNIITMTAVILFTIYLSYLSIMTYGSYELAVRITTLLEDVYETNTN